MKKPAAIILLLCCVALVGAVAFYGGRKSSRRELDRLRRELANAPEARTSPPAAWVKPDNTTSPTPTPPQGEAAKTPAAAESAAPPFAIDVTQPVRISWPLDVGPDAARDRADERLALRGRQGVNELQEPGTGWALYAFRLASAARCQSWFRVRWVNDGVGSIACDNSWFVRFDDRPARVITGSNEDWSSAADRWHWQRGPDVSLTAGVHWLRVELREDGVLMDRAALVPLDGRARAGTLDALVPTHFAAFAGELPPTDPQRPVGEVECAAAPTASLVIGRGHVNEIAVTLSWQGLDPAGFRGTLDVRCPTAKLTVEGDPRVACDARHPWLRRVLRLRFADDTTRRTHRVSIRLLRESPAADASAASSAVPPASRLQPPACIYAEEIAFVKPWAWAFLGPFRDIVPRGDGNAPGFTRAKDEPDPRRLAMRESPQRLGVDATWRMIDDGSCCDWTGAVDLRKVYGRRTNVTAWAVTWIHAQTTLHHRSFSFQADDAGWLWMNGRYLVALPVDLPKEANRLWTSAHLQPGLNPVVIRLSQNQRYWGFRLDVVDWHWQGRRGDLITGAAVSQWPTAK